MNKILLLIAITLSSCAEPNVEASKTSHIIRYGQNPLDEIVIDSCQYLYGDWGNATVLTHKGNCNNPIHKGGEQ